MKWFIKFLFTNFKWIKSKLNKTKVIIHHLLGEIEVLSCLKDINWENRPLLNAYVLTMFFCCCCTDYTKKKTVTLFWRDIRYILTWSTLPLFPEIEQVTDKNQTLKYFHISNPLVLIKETKTILITHTSSWRISSILKTMQFMILIIIEEDLLLEACTPMIQTNEMKYTGLCW